MQCPCGCAPATGQQPLTLLEPSAHYQLNGRVNGYGHIERTAPGGIVRKP
ncbi:MAG: hypothetical protein ABW034_23315 [Steroidobacteraceae bacterium]